MNERDFSINDVNYRCNKMNALEQFHVVRRMGPILKDLFPALAKMKGKIKPEGESSDDDKLQLIAELISPIMDGFSKLSDEDANKVMMSLLGCVEAEQKPMGWAKISNGTQLLFQNLEFPTMIQLAGRAFMFNLAGFFNVLPQASPGGR